MDTQEDKIMFQDFANVNEFVNDVLKPVFPNIKLANSFMSSSPEVSAASFEGKLLSSKIFENTVYEYKGDGKFIHFTSLFGVKAILDHGYLRMSELENLSDKSELNYANDVFRDNTIFNCREDILKEIKSNVFCLSACESNANTIRDSFMWEVYGDRGKGVVIEFEIKKPNPFFFTLGKMQYGEDSKAPLKKIRELAENYIQNKNKIFPNNFCEFLAEIQSFHKSQQFASEQEVRLLLKKDKYQEPESIYTDINSKQEVRKFNKLFLKGRHPLLDLEYGLSDDPEAVLDEFPQIEIKKIVLGFGISIENKIDITTLLNIIKENHKYEYEIFQIDNEKDIRKMC
jgi:hypothetical protein